MRFFAQKNKIWGHITPNNGGCSQTINSITNNGCKINRLSFIALWATLKKPFHRTKASFYRIYFYELNI